MAPPISMAHMKRTGPDRFEAGAHTHAAEKKVKPSMMKNMGQKPFRALDGTFSSE
jgi:hypothetical protein